MAQQFFAHIGTHDFALKRRGVCPRRLARGVYQSLLLLCRSVRLSGF